LAAIGVDGIPKCDVAGNVLRTHTTMVWTMRIPPNCDKEQAKKNVEQVLLKDIPYNAKVELDWVSAGAGFQAPIYPNHIEEIISECSKEAFENNDFYYSHEGGSIPFMGALQKTFPTSYFMVTGVLGPGSNAHAGDECIDVDYLKKIFHAMTRFVQKTTFANWEMTGAKDLRQRFKTMI